MFLQRVIEAFNANKISYALAGGYAVALHGAVRGTVDVDLLVPMDEKSLVLVERALISLGLVSRAPVSAKEIANFREEYITKRNMKVWSFVNPNWPVEAVDILILYDLQDFKVVKRATVFGDVKIISLLDLIRMKKEAGRPQDIADVEALEKLQSI